MWGGGGWVRGGGSPGCRPPPPGAVRSARWRISLVVPCACGCSFVAVVVAAADARVVAVAVSVGSAFGRSDKAPPVVGPCFASGRRSFPTAFPLVTGTPSHSGCSCAVPEPTPDASAHSQTSAIGSGCSQRGTREWGRGGAGGGRPGQCGGGEQSGLTHTEIRRDMEWMT